MNELSNLLAILLAIVLSAALVVDMRRDVRRLISGRNTVLLGMAAWYIFEAIQLPDELYKYSQEQYDYGLLCVALAFLAFLIAYHSASQIKLFDGFGYRLQRLDRPDTIWKLTFTGLIIGFAPLVIVAKGNLWLIIQDAGLKGRWQGVFMRGRYGGLRDAMLELQMFLRAVLPLALIILMDRRQPSERRVVVALFCVWMICREFSDGTRGKALMSVAPLLGILYWRLRPELQKRLLVFLLPPLAVLVYTWSAAVVATRNAGDFDWQAADEVTYVGNEMFRETLFITQNTPEPIAYCMGETYFVQLVNPIPRFLWRGKPVGDAGLILARAYGAVNEYGEPTMTVSPGIIGEMYLNFGLLGVIGISALGGVIIRSWDRLRTIAEYSLPTFLIFVAGLAIVFISGRSFNMPPLYGMIALYVLLRFV